MTTRIGNVTLDYDMVWEDEFLHPMVNASAEETIGGGLYIQEFAGMEIGRPITLQSRDGHGLQYRSTVLALKALADVTNAYYSLVISTEDGSLSRYVRFRNEVDGGAVQFEPAWTVDGVPHSGMTYQGTIHLQVVGTGTTTTSSTTTTTA